MKNSMKKLVTVGLVATMTLGSTLTVFAEDITTAAAKDTTGTSTINHVNKDVYKITLPSDTVLAGALSYVADPQGLVAATDGAEFSLPEGAEVGDAQGVYFKNYDAAGAVTGVSGTSESFVITNKSSRGVALAIEAKLTEEESGKYEGDYSTTADFSGTGDSAKGLYIGVQGSNEVKATALTATKADIKNVAFTAGDNYEISYADSAYKYDLKTPAEGEELVFPTYTFKITGALNGDVADTVWGTTTDGTYTAKKMPKINIKFTPSLITAKEAIAVKDDGAGAIYLGKVDATDSDGLFGETKPTALKINGKELQSADLATANEDGYVKVPFDKLCKAYGITPSQNNDSEEEEAVWNIAKTIEFTVGGVDYCAEVPAVE